MNREIIVIGAGLIGLVWTMNTQGKNIVEETGSGTMKPLDDIYKEQGQRFGVDWKLLKALAIVESSERPQVKNPADPSYGLMQVLCVPDGNGGCSNKFNIEGWPPAKAEDLYDAEYNVSLGAQIIKWNIETFGFEKGIAVYNNWSARNEQAPYSNQSYVDKVLREFRNLGGEVS